MKVLRFKRFKRGINLNKDEIKRLNRECGLGIPIPIPLNSCLANQIPLHGAIIIDQLQSSF